MSQIYRKTTTGITLQETLDQFIEENKITKEVAQLVLQQYDETMVRLLSTSWNKKVSITGDLSAYRFFGDIWTLILKNAVISADKKEMVTDKLKIIAVDSKCANLK